MTKAKNLTIKAETSFLTRMSFPSISRENSSLKNKAEFIDLSHTSYETEETIPPTEYESLKKDLLEETNTSKYTYSIKTFHYLHYQYSDEVKIEMMKTALHRLHIIMQEGPAEKYSLYLRQFHELIEKNRNPGCFNKLGIPLSKCPDLIELIYRLLFLALNPTHPNNRTKGVNIAHIRELISDVTSAKTIHLMWASRVKKSKMHTLIDNMLKMHEENLTQPSIATNKQKK